MTKDSRDSRVIRVSADLQVEHSTCWFTYALQICCSCPAPDLFFRFKAPWLETLLRQHSSLCTNSITCCGGLLHVAQKAWKLVQQLRRPAVLTWGTGKVAFGAAAGLFSKALASRNSYVWSTSASSGPLVCTALSCLNLSGFFFFFFFREKSISNSSMADPMDPPFKWQRRGKRGACGISCVELEFDDVDVLELLKRKFPSPKKLKRDQMLQRPPSSSPQKPEAKDKPSPSQTLKLVDKPSPSQKPRQEDKPSPSQKQKTEPDNKPSPSQKPRQEDKKQKTEPDMKPSPKPEDKQEDRPSPGLKQKLSASKT